MPEKYFPDFFSGGRLASAPLALEQLRRATLNVLLVGLVLEDHLTKLVKKLAQLRHTGPHLRFKLVLTLVRYLSFFRYLGLRRYSRIA